MKYKICPACGRRFEAEGRIKYCSDTCRSNVKKKYDKEAYERYKNRERKHKADPARALRLAEIERMARESGMHYGQYVALNNL